MNEEDATERVREMRVRTMKERNNFGKSKRKEEAVEKERKRGTEEGRRGKKKRWGKKRRMKDEKK